LREITSWIRDNLPKIETAIMGLFLIITGIGMLSISWRKWPDILVDFGRELYIPWQLTEGKVLYLDVAHYYGPFSQYFNALLFKLFGTGLMTLAWFNIGLIIALVLLIYYFFSSTTDKYVAFAASATFLLMFAFSQYVVTGNYNFVCPYSHELTHGVFLAFVAFVIFLQFLRQHRIVYLTILGITTGIIFLTKLEVFIAVMVALSAGFICLAVIEKPKISRFFIKSLGMGVIGFIIPVFCFLVYFSTYMPYETAIKVILYPYSLLLEKAVSSNIFALRNLGFDEPFFNISMMGFVAIEYILIIAIMGFLTLLIARIKNKAFRISMAVCILILIFIFSAFYINYIRWTEIFRPLPLVMLLLAIYFLVEIFKTRNDRQSVIRTLSLFVVTVFASVLLLKIILNVHVYHYGFALAMPAVLLLIMALLYQLPKSLGRAMGGVGFFRGLAVALLLVVLIAHVLWSKKIYDLKTYPVGRGHDMILSWNPAILPQGLAIDLALQQIQKFIRKDQSFVVFPEGIILNYLSRRQSASSNFEFMPILVARVGEERIISDLTARKPDFIILMHRDTSEYGARYFGMDYAENLFSWIGENYVSIVRIGEVPLHDNKFGIIIAQRIDLQKTH